MAMPSLPDDRTTNSRRVKPTNIVLFLAILINHEKVDSLIVQGPSDTTAMVNESTYFNCSTSIRPVDERSIIWYHYPLDGGGQRSDVYDEGIIRTNYKNRFAIDKDLSSGALNLVVLRLESKDAGKYECKDHVHEDIGASAELTVLDSDLLCESDMDSGGVVGPTQCDRFIAPDEVQLSCSVAYNGKNTPQMVWRKVRDSSNSTETDCVNNDNSVTCNTTLTANLQLNESVYICELPTQQHYCSLKMKNILYAFANITQTDYYTGDEVTCVADASRQLPCSYQWYKNNTTEVSSNETFKSNDPGLYMCQAECLIRNDSCKFTAMVISVSTVPFTAMVISVSTVPFTATVINVSTVPDSGQHLLNWLWFLVVFVIIGVILVILYRRTLLRWLRQCRCNKRNERQSFGETEDPPVNPLLKQQAKDTKTTSSKIQAIELKGDITQGRIERYRKWLEERMDPDSGLLDALLTNKTLSGKEISEVKGKSTFYNRSSQLLDYILEKRQGDRLIAALRDTEQLHIVNYLNTSGEYSREYGGAWPLTANEISILNTNQNSLIDILRLSDLPGRLYFSKVINKKQMNLISLKPNTDGKTEEKSDILLRRSKATALLDILRRRSIRDYRQTILCLRQSKQSHIAAILETGGDANPGTPQIEIPSEPQIDNPSGKYEYYPDILGSIKIAAANETVSVITGLTMLHDELFIVSEFSSEVEVYHATEFNFIRRWGIGLADPGGIDSCNRKQCIYIVGWKKSGGSTILRVKPQGEQITEWPVTDSWSYLSVTDNSNVILTVHGEWKLIEYSPNGKLKREIKLSPDACKFINNLWHSVKLSSGDFVVCCGVEVDDLHGVFILDARGNIQKVFGLNKDFKIARLHQPVHLVVDKDDFVLVADCNNNRVLLFNSNLEYQKELIFQENGELQFPSILYLDESRGLLYLVDHDANNESRVLIFRLGLTFPAAERAEELGCCGLDFI